MNFTLSKEQLIPFLNSLKKKMQVIVPVRNELGATCFSELDDSAEQEIFLDARTDFSPKNFFLPAAEKMFRFGKSNFSYKISQLSEKKPAVIFGIRPCDTHALHALDELFIGSLGPDQYYSERRKNALLIALQCTKECDSGFCTSMGTSQATGHDLLFIERGSDFFVTAASERGKRLLDSKFFKQTKDAAPSPRIECKKELLTQNLEENLLQNFEHGIWKQEAEKCLSCTNCTQSCPTCYCHYKDDEFEFDSMDSTRYRMQDSCQLLRFSQVAGGNIFRKSRTGRLRQFVLHKLCYYKKRFGTHLCVGCGRCIAACPAKIDLTEIANTIQKEAEVEK